jgi:hypothetical protein
MGGRCCNN